MKVVLYLPDGKKQILEDISSVYAEAMDGEVEILDKHEPFATVVSGGKIEIKDKEGKVVWEAKDKDILINVERQKELTVVELYVLAFENLA